MIDQFLESLTKREREVYELRCAGFKNKEISRKLGIQQRTVEVFALAIGQKAAVHGLVWGKCMVKKPEVRA